MTPHCDALDGPIVRAATKALDEANVHYVLPWVPAEAEREAWSAFDDTMHAREKHPDARKVADRWFFETVVRLHRLGEGAPYTGLKPAGLPVGLGVRLAEKALHSGDTEELEDYVENEAERIFRAKMEQVQEFRDADPRDTAKARRSVHAVLSFIRFTDALYRLFQHDERQERVRRAEIESKEKLTREYIDEHPFTVESLMHHHG